MYTLVDTLRYTLVCTPWYMYTLPTPGICTPPTHPGYTHHPTHHGVYPTYCTRLGSVRADDALGSVLRLVIAMRRIEPSILPKV